MLYVTAPWYAQRMFAARDENTAYRSMLVTTVLIALGYFFIMGVSALSRVGWPDLAAEDAARGFANAVVHWMPIGLRGLMLAMIFAVCQTTMSSIWNTNVAMIEQDFYVGLFRPDASDRERLRASRVITLILAVLTIVGSMFFMKYLLASLLVADVLLTVLLFPCLGGFYFWWTNGKGAVVSMIVTLVIGFGTMALKWGDHGLDHNKWMPLYVAASLPAMFLVGIGVSLMTKVSPEERERRLAFHDKVGPPLCGKQAYLRAKS